MVFVGTEFDSLAVEARIFDPKLEERDKRLRDDAGFVVMVLVDVFFVRLAKERENFPPSLIVMGASFTRLFAVN